MEINFTQKFENKTILNDLFTESVDDLPVFKIVIIVCSLILFSTFSVILIIILCRKRFKRLNFNNDSFNAPNEEDKNKPIEEHQLLNEKTKSILISRDLNNPSKVSNTRHQHSLKHYSNNIRQKPDALLLSLSSQLPDYDSLFDSTPILDQLEDSNNINFFNDNLVYAHNSTKSVFLNDESQNFSTTHMGDKKLLVKSENKKLSVMPENSKNCDNLYIKSHRKTKGIFYKPADMTKSKTKNIIKKETYTRAEVSQPISEVHEYDVVYVPHNCPASINNRVDLETSYIRSTWKKRRSFLYEEISDVVRRISARLRPDSSHRQSSNSNGSNGASRNIDNSKLNQLNASNRISTSSDINNNLPSISQLHTSSRVRNGESIYNNVSAAAISNLDLNILNNIGDNGVAPEVPKHARLEDTPVAPIRTVSNIQRKV